MSSAVGQSAEIEQLKTLLFQSEEARLSTLEADVAFLQQYLGNADRLEAATADILIAALMRAEVNRPRELANAIAPSVVSAIRSEIANSRDLMVDALYPLTGRLVRAAVANAFKELVVFLEERINAYTSRELWTGRIKSLITGRPISEFVVATGNPLLVTRLLIIERGNGRLVAEWTRATVPDEQVDLLTAMVAAVLEFSIQALAGKGSLEKLDFGGRQILLRASPRYILTAECTGVLLPLDEAWINSLFFDEIDSISGSSYDATRLAVVAASIEAKPRSPPKTNRRGKIVLCALAALAASALVGLVSRSVSRTMLESRTNVAVEHLVAEQPLLASFPLSLNFDHGNQSLTVSGIEPSDEDVALVIRNLTKAAVPYRIVDRIGIVPGLKQTAQIRGRVETAEHTLARMEADFNDTRAKLAFVTKLSMQQYIELREQYDRLNGVADEVRRQLADESQLRNQQHARVIEHQNKLQAIIEAPSEQLARFSASTAVFFGKGDEFVNRKEAERQIKKLASLLAGNGMKIRIVGHADDSGSEAPNRVVARKRAIQVMRSLIALGIQPSRLSVVSRAASMPISERIDGMGGGNRRVTFENVFVTEPSP